MNLTQRIRHIERHAPPGRKGDKTPLKDLPADAVAAAEEFRRKYPSMWAYFERAAPRPGPEVSNDPRMQSDLIAMNRLFDPYRRSHGLGGRASGR